jgi:hypothetical protein
MANFCPSCGAPLQPSGDPGAGSSATTALVLSIIGLLCLPIVFSVIGLEPIAKRQFCNSNGVGRLRPEWSGPRLWGIAYAKM